MKTCEHFRWTQALRKAIPVYRILAPVNRVYGGDSYDSHRLGIAGNFQLSRGGAS